MHSAEQFMLARLDQRQEAGNLRNLSTAHARVDFFSNDYLGIATCGVQGAKHGCGWASGATGARLLSGNSKAAEDLERTIAAFHDEEAALLFNSGYHANIGLLASIAGRHTTFLYDELCHASIIDGIRLGICAGKHKFRHNNIADLEEKLKRSQAGSVFIVVESVYSMDGDLAPLVDLVRLAKKYAASLIVDEAHSIGVFGDRGAGMVQQLGLQHEVFARVHSFGKALGCHGAVVVGSELLKNYLINFARTFIYTTALPPQSLADINRAYAYLASDHFTNMPLHELIHYFRGKIAKSAVRGWRDSNSAIQALVVGENNKAKALAKTLQQQGLQIQAILHPTVAKGTERLRICLHSFNTTEQVDLLFDLINDHVCTLQ